MATEHNGTHGNITFGGVSPFVAGLLSSAFMAVALFTVRVIRILISRRKKRGMTAAFQGAVLQKRALPTTRQAGNHHVSRRTSAKKK